MSALQTSVPQSHRKSGHHSVTSEQQTTLRRALIGLKDGIALQHGQHNMQPLTHEQTTTGALIRSLIEQLQRPSETSRAINGIVFAESQYTDLDNIGWGQKLAVRLQTSYEPRFADMATSAVSHGPLTNVGR